MNTTYHALRTIGTDGVSIVDRPPAERIIESSENYMWILTVCRRHRVNTYRHRVSGETRSLSEQDWLGCAVSSDPDRVALFEWLSRADLVGHGEYAIPVSDGMLWWFHKPDTTPEPAKPGGAPGGVAA